MKFGVLMLFGLSVCLLGLTGCETLIDTPGENFDRVAHAIDTDGKMIPIDVERQLFIYKPTELDPEAISQQ